MSFPSGSAEESVTIASTETAAIAPTIPTASTQSTQQPKGTQPKGTQKKDKGEKKKTTREPGKEQMKTREPPWLALAIAFDPNMAIIRGLDVEKILKLYSLNRIAKADGAVFFLL